MFFGITIHLCLTPVGDQIASGITGDSFGFLTRCGTFSLLLALLSFDLMCYLQTSRPREVYYDQQFRGGFFLQLHLYKRGSPAWRGTMKQSESQDQRLFSV